MSQNQPIRKACASSTISYKISKLLSFRSSRCISRYAKLTFTLALRGGPSTADTESLDQAYLDHDTGRIVLLAAAFISLGVEVRWTYPW